MEGLLLQLWVAILLISHLLAVDETVNTTSGLVHGKRSTIEGIDVLTFSGIPYAEPPTGNLRFKPPKLKTRMTDIINATGMPPLCAQRLTIVTDLDHALTKPFTVNGTFNGVASEDCLFLNAFVPASATLANPLPIMVWIHGGGFTLGTAILVEGHVLAALNGVIVVTVNYRLGVFGFLDTEDDVSVGNFGLRDQIMALRWIKENIAEFGGNPSDVTVAGESAGAACVSQLIISPLTEGLIKRAIIQSGNPFAYWTHTNAPLENAKAFGEQMGCETSTTSLLVECLRLKSMDEVIIQQLSGMLEWAPSYRSDIFPEDPMNYKSSDSTPSWVHKIRNMDILMGNNKQEGSLFYYYAVLPLNDTENGITEVFFLQSMRRMAMLKIPAKHVGNLLPTVKYVYTDWENVDNRISLAKKMTDLLGDLYIYVDEVKFSRLIAGTGDTGQGRLYYYQLNPRPSWMTTWPWTQGADHADDLFFVFGHPFSRSYLNATEQEKLLSRRIMTYWANFIKTGNPNLPTNVSVKWPEYTKEEEQFLELDTEITENNINSHMLADRMALWTDFVPQELKRLNEITTQSPCAEQTTDTASWAERMVDVVFVKCYITLLFVYILL